MKVKIKKSTLNNITVVFISVLLAILSISICYYEIKQINDATDNPLTCNITSVFEQVEGVHIIGVVHETEETFTKDIKCPGDQYSCSRDDIRVQKEYYQKKNIIKCFDYKDEIYFEEELPIIGEIIAFTAFIIFTICIILSLWACFENIGERRNFKCICSVE